jgi:hypothetical protein
MNYQPKPLIKTTQTERPIIGLDLDEDSSVRLVFIELDSDGTTPTLVDHRRFQTLGQFKSYWTKYVKDPEVRVAVSLQNVDPLKVLPWLVYQGVTIDRHSYPGRKWTRLRLKDEFALWTPGLSKSYQQAYTVAFLSAYRLQSATIARQLVNHAVCMREMLTELEDELRRLADALPDYKSLTIV